MAFLLKNPQRFVSLDKIVNNSRNRDYLMATALHEFYLLVDRIVHAGFVIDSRSFRGKFKVKMARNGQRKTPRNILIFFGDIF
jgi:hypothetical protein